MSMFKNPNELSINATIKMLVYGQPGIGKTTIALSSPNPVLFDFDGGVSRINKAHQCPTLQVESWEQVLDALTELEQANDFKTIVVDTAGKMLDFMSDYIMRNDPKMKMRDGSLALKGYGQRKVMFVNLLKRVSMMGKHIVFVAHEKEDKDGETRIVRPDMSGSSLGDLLKELDLVGYMQAYGKTAPSAGHRRSGSMPRTPATCPHGRKSPSSSTSMAASVARTISLPRPLKAMPPTSSSSRSLAMTTPHWCRRSVTMWPG